MFPLFLWGGGQGRPSMSCSVLHPAMGAGWNMGRSLWQDWLCELSQRCQGGDTGSARTALSVPSPRAKAQPWIRGGCGWATGGICRLCTSPLGDCGRCGAPQTLGVTVLSVVGPKPPRGDSAQCGGSQTRRGDCARCDAPLLPGVTVMDTVGPQTPGVTVPGAVGPNPPGVAVPGAVGPPPARIAHSRPAAPRTPGMSWPPQPPRCGRGGAGGGAGGGVGARPRLRGGVRPVPPPRPAPGRSRARSAEPSGARRRRAGRGAAGCRATTTSCWSGRGGGCCARSAGSPCGSPSASPPAATASATPACRSSSGEPHRDVTAAPP